ncbi:LptM family lipoprotein [Streptococcus suis]
MKKIVGMLAVVLSLFVLAACGSKEESLDGEYHRYFLSSNTNEMTVSEVEKIEIEGVSGILEDWKEFAVDTEKKILIFENRSMPYVFKDNVLSFNGDTYVKVGTEKYKEIYAEYEETLKKYDKE